ncbi:MAG: hypothetical protein B6I28_05800 [Fusobacteriia bacterium 4572_132]|nr:MAG: hypothetical protein B6I28_05800 [Fusobacteriia bacterium 4572_132]
MFNRIKQGITFLIPNYTKKDNELMEQYLNYAERKIFFEMSKYDKKHSIKVLKDVMKSNLKDNQMMLKLALLHDVGKENISLLERINYVLFQKSEKMKNHTKKGFEKLKNINLELANLILIHHNEDLQDENMIEFQKIDDKN